MTRSQICSLRAKTELTDWIPRKDRESAQSEGSRPDRSSSRSIGLIVMTMFGMKFENWSAAHAQSLCLEIPTRPNLRLIDLNIWSKKAGYRRAHPHDARLVQREQIHHLSRVTLNSASSEPTRHWRSGNEMCAVHLSEHINQPAIQSKPFSQANL